MSGEELRQPLVVGFMAANVAASNTSRVCGVNDMVSIT
jgi:hypothetical protein